MAIIATYKNQELGLFCQWQEKTNKAKKALVVFETLQDKEEFDEFVKKENEKDWDRTWIGMGNPDPNEPDFGYEDLIRYRRW